MDFCLWTAQLPFFYFVFSPSFSADQEIDHSVLSRYLWNMATHSLATWVFDLKTSSLPSSVQIAALRSFYNYAGCTIAGCNHSATSIAYKSLSPFFTANPTSSLLGTQGKSKIDAPYAALINGIASHVHDYDDTHLSTIIHPTGVVASALLAYAEFSSLVLKKPITGNDFLCSLVAGIEVECLLGLAVWPSHYDVGWHITATVGSIGAAVAVGKAMGLSVERLQHAIGIASSQVTGMREHFGSHSKALGVGRAAQEGLAAAFMAKEGMTSAEESLEGKRGWVACVCPEREAAKQKLTDFIAKLEAGNGLDDDDKWGIEKNAFKPFPCGIVIHPVIDGCAQLYHEGLEVDKITSVNLRVHPLVLELTGKKNPKDGLQGKFSVYHGAACGLLFGKATPAQYEDDIVVQTTAMREKIEAQVDKSLKADECWIEVELEGGRHEQKHVEHAIGSLDVPITDEQLTEKFLDQTKTVLGEEKAARASKVLWSMHNTEDVAEVSSDL